MDGIEYPERIERMLDVMIAIPKNAWGLVFLEVEKEIGAAALERIILQAYQIEKAIGYSKGKGVTKKERRSPTNAPKIIASMLPPKQSRGDQLPM